MKKKNVCVYIYIYIQFKIEKVINRQTIYYSKLKLLSFLFYFIFSPSVFDLSYNLQIAS